MNVCRVLCVLSGSSRRSLASVLHVSTSLLALSFVASATAFASLCWTVALLRGLFVLPELEAARCNLS